MICCSRLFRLHENLGKKVIRNLVQSEIDGGVRLQDLELGSMLRVYTQNTCYEIVVLHGGLASLRSSALLPVAGAADQSSVPRGAALWSKCAASVEVCTSSFVIPDIPHPLSPPSSKRSANAGVPD
jgi:hypothetical protein